MKEKTLRSTKRGKNNAHGACGQVTELNKKTKSTLLKNKRMRNNDFGLKTSGSRTNVLFSLNRNVVVCVCAALCSLFCIWLHFFCHSLYYCVYVFFVLFFFVFFIGATLVPFSCFSLPLVSNLSMAIVLMKLFYVYTFFFHF